MDFFEIRNIISDFFVNMLKSSGKIIELHKNEDRWVSKVEMIEESDYLRKLGKMDIIGVYEIEIGLDGGILGYKRLYMRERGDLTAEKGGE